MTEALVFLSPIRLKPACNDKLECLISIRNISKVCSDSHGCFILTNLVVLGFFGGTEIKKIPNGVCLDVSEAYC